MPLGGLLAAWRMARRAAWSSASPTIDSVRLSRRTSPRRMPASWVRPKLMPPSQMSAAGTPRARAMRSTISKPGKLALATPSMSRRMAAVGTKPDSRMRWLRRLADHT